MAMLMEVSSSIRATRPKMMALDTVKWNEPALGRRHMTMTATKAPNTR